MTTCPKCQQKTQSLAYHTCQMTEERVRSLIAEALTEKEEHIRRVVRQELEAGALADEVGATLDRDVRNAALEEAATAIDGLANELYGGERFDVSRRGTKSLDKGLGAVASAAVVRALKHTLPDQERQESVVVGSNARGPVNSPSERPDPASPCLHTAMRHYPEGETVCVTCGNVVWKRGEEPSASPSALREFVEAVQELRDIIPGHWDEIRKLDEARSRLDVGEIERLRSDLKKANEALDEIADRLRKDTISKRDADDKAFSCVWDIVTIVTRTGRLK